MWRRSAGSTERYSSGAGRDCSCSSRTRQSGPVRELRLVDPAYTSGDGRRCGAHNDGRMTGRRYRCDLAA